MFGRDCGVLFVALLVVVVAVAAAAAYCCLGIPKMYRSIQPLLLQLPPADTDYSVVGTVDIEHTLFRLFSNNFDPIR